MTTTIQPPPGLAEMSVRIGEQVFEDYRQIIQDATDARPLEAILAALEYGSLTPEKRGQIENLIATKIFPATKEEAPRVVSGGDCAETATPRKSPSLHL